METKIYVGNLSYDTKEDELKELFAQAGTVASVALIKDRDTGQSKGFAFVEMSNQSEAEKAIQMFNGYTLGNRPLKAVAGGITVVVAAAVARVAADLKVAVSAGIRKIELPQVFLRELLYPISITRARAPSDPSSFNGRQ